MNILAISTGEVNNLILKKLMAATGRAWMPVKSTARSYPGRKLVLGNRSLKRSYGLVGNKSCPKKKQLLLSFGITCWLSSMN